MKQRFLSVVILMLVSSVIACSPSSKTNQQNPSPNLTLSQPVLRPSMVSQIGSSVSRFIHKILPESLISTITERPAPYPEMDAKGNRTGYSMRIYDPCRDKPCPKKEDIETEEDRQFSYHPHPTEQKR